MPQFTPQLAARLVALGLAMAILQVAAVSQIELFGTNADLTPLVVAAVGLMVGSLPVMRVGTLYGVRLRMMGRGPVLPRGMKISVLSFTPSRIGIITSRLT